MYGVELYAAVRLAVVDEGLSHREAARRFGLDRRTVKKMLRYSAPPGYRRSRPLWRMIPPPLTLRSLGQRLYARAGGHRVPLPWRRRATAPRAASCPRA